MANGARVVGHVVTRCVDTVLSNWAFNKPAESIDDWTITRTARWLVGTVCGSTTATDSGTRLDCYFATCPVGFGAVMIV